MLGRINFFSKGSAGLRALFARFSNEKKLRAFFPQRFAKLKKTRRFTCRMPVLQAIRQRKIFEFALAAHYPQKPHCSSYKKIFKTNIF
jgi:hypothetical protein